MKRIKKQTHWSWLLNFSVEFVYKNIKHTHSVQPNQNRISKTGSLKLLAIILFLSLLSLCLWLFLLRPSSQFSLGLHTTLCLSFYPSISYANWLDDSKCDKNYPLVAAEQATQTRGDMEDGKKPQKKSSEQQAAGIWPQW